MAMAMKQPICLQAFISLTLNNFNLPADWFGGAFIEITIQSNGILIMTLHMYHFLPTVDVNFVEIFIFMLDKRHRFVILAA